jgi:hypothetical protein
MTLRLATFNIENLMSRFDFSGFRNHLKQDRVLRLFDVKNEAEYQRLEEARTIAYTDDTRQMSALAIADCDADILCLQEADNMVALQAFEYGYLFRMVGNGYRRSRCSSCISNRWVRPATGSTGARPRCRYDQPRSPPSAASSRTALERIIWMARCSPSAAT